MPNYKYSDPMSPPDLTGYSAQSAEAILRGGAAVSGAISQGFDRVAAARQILAEMSFREKQADTDRRAARELALIREQGDIDRTRMYGDIQLRNQQVGDRALEDRQRRLEGEKQKYEQQIRAEDALASNKVAAGEPIVSASPGIAAEAARQGGERMVREADMKRIVQRREALAGEFRAASTATDDKTPVGIDPEFAAEVETSLGNAWDDKSLDAAAQTLSGARERTSDYRRSMAAIEKIEKSHGKDTEFLRRKFSGELEALKARARGTTSDKIGGELGDMLQRFDAGEMGRERAASSGGGKVDNNPSGMREVHVMRGNEQDALTIEYAAKESAKKALVGEVENGLDPASPEYAQRLQAEIDADTFERVLLAVDADGKPAAEQAMLAVYGLTPAQATELSNAVYGGASDAQIMEILQGSKRQQRPAEAPAAAVNVEAPAAPPKSATKANGPPMPEGIARRFDELQGRLGGLSDSEAAEMRDIQAHFDTRKTAESKKAKDARSRGVLDEAERAMNAPRR